MRSGIAGRLADLFLDSKLTPLALAAALGVGLWSVFSLPAREEPEIVVPVADIHLPMPGLSPEEVENRALLPLEEVLGGIEDVRYVYSRAEAGFGLVTVRFRVGTEMEKALTRLHSHLLGNVDRLPTGLGGLPLVKTVTIDDVPFFSVTLHGQEVTHHELRRLAEELAVELRAVEDVRGVDVTGGPAREVRVELAPDRMAALGVDPPRVVEGLRDANAHLHAGSFSRASSEVRVDAGPFLRSAAEVEEAVLDVRKGRLVQVRDVGRVVDGPAEVDTYTFHSLAGEPDAPMVTLAVSKRPGADETRLGELLSARIEAEGGRLFPDGVEAVVTRNYGETAREKVSTLRMHLLLAILGVGAVVAGAMGWRAGVVVMTVVPVTFALTLLTYHLFDYSLNRVTLFALIFVTGIVVDDAIIIVENMHRHFSMGDRPRRAAARAAVDEVGNPTILTTLTVIAAVLPMLFVSGLMGPYMSPMPVGASVAVTFSLLVALIGAPWLAYRILGEYDVGNEGSDGVDSGAEDSSEEGVGPLEKSFTYRAYRAVMEPLLRRPWRLWSLLGAVGVLMVGSIALFLTRVVTVKMLPFDDKDEIQVIVDMPEGTTLEATDALSADLVRAVSRVPEVAHVQRYVGTAAPFNFNGMIRRYYLRRGPAVADLQVNLVGRKLRDAQSHEVAGRIRSEVEKTVRRSGTGARVKVAEVPPGPPVLSTLVAEVYGRDRGAQIETAQRIMDAFEAEPGVVDVDWSLGAPQREVRFLVDRERAALAGLSQRRLVESLRVGLAGMVATNLSAPESRVEVPVRVRLASSDRSGSERLAGLHLVSREGAMVPVAEAVEAVEDTVAQPIDRKNGRRVIYVLAEVAGEKESPIYAIADLEDRLNALELPGGTGLERVYTRQPRDVERPVMKWDGEWQVTYEVFRDLGVAFAGALLLIYLLIVAWFGSLTTPVVMMAAIPLTLIGIVPGHAAFGAFFTATSMIGMIALAGIMVRNGILLIDFLELRLADGAPLERAILEAGAVRTRPIVLTAGTVVIGAGVILFDPIFEGLAVSLITGSVASTALTLVVVPGLYYLLRRNGAAQEGPAEDDGEGRSVAP